MAFKTFALDEGTSITVYKRKASRSLRLSVAPDGTVRVSIPTWAPYKAGIEFARSRQAWIETQQRPASLLAEGQQIGKAHHLRFAPDAARDKPASRLKDSEVVISYPIEVDPASPAVQAIATKASIRALRQQAEQLLPQRLAGLALRHGFDYKSVTVKQLKGRWGSCDHQKNIVLNLFLMQLPWDLIDYVLLHELAHTEVLRHGPDFWTEMEKLIPDVKATRKRLRDYHPVLNSSS